jgi:hypothetical protein
MSEKSEDKLSFLKTGLMYIGLLLSVVATFLGTIHYFKGQLVMAIILTLVLTLGIYFLLDQLMRKRAELRKNSSYNKNLSILLYGLYTILALPLSYFSVHGINVELNAKNQVKNQYGNVRVELNEMNVVYSKQSVDLVKFIEIDLQNLMTLGNKAKLLSKYNLDEATLKSAKETDVRTSKKSAIESGLKVTFQKEINDFEPTISKSLDNIAKWNLFELHNAMAVVDSQMPILKKKIVALYQAEATKYEYTPTITLPSSKREFELSKPMELLSKNGAYALLLIGLLQHFLLLAPLMMTSSTKVYKSRKVGGGIEL